MLMIFFTSYQSSKIINRNTIKTVSKVKSTNIIQKSRNKLLGLHLPMAVTVLVVWANAPSEKSA